MELENPRARALDREAADWFARLNGASPSEADREAFRAWARDPGCLAAYERIEGIWRGAGTMAGDPDIQRALAEVPAARSRWGRFAIMSPRGAGVALAAAMALVMGLVLLPRPADPETFATGVGERRAVRLVDGSTVQLDTGSAIEVRFTNGGRDLKLVSGQALFDVAKDADRPFRVQAGDMRVDAIGTRFAVRRDGPQVRVTLLEGRVNVLRDEGDKRQWSLSPGQYLEVQPGPSAEQAEPMTADVASAESWTEGRLMFRSMPLAAAVSEINRYSNAKNRLDAGVDGATPVSGVFDTADAPAFANAVASLYDLQASPQRDGGIVLGAR